MKKMFVVVSIIFYMIPFLFADSSNYYRDGNVVDNMYVNSLEGLKVRDSPSLEGKRICGLPHRLLVKIVAIGTETTIDGITAPWIEVLIPSYEWKNNIPSYGWVFGGYLSPVLPLINLKKPTKKELEVFLTSKMWIHSNFPSVTKFRHNGIYSSSKMASGGMTAGPFTVIDTDRIKIETRSGDEEGTFSDGIRYLKVKILSEDMIKINNTIYNSYIDPESYNLEDVSDFIYSKYYNESLYVYIFKNNPYKSEFTETKKLKTVDELIRFGVSAEGSQYESRYHDYWYPIMKEHQLKVTRNQV